MKEGKTPDLENLYKKPNILKYLKGKRLERVDEMVMFGELIETLLFPIICIMCWLGTRGKEEGNDIDRQSEQRCK